MRRSTTLAGLALASALALAGCAGDTEETTGDAVSEITASVPESPQADGDPSASPSGAGISAVHNDADMMFARAMRVHHEQAVQMSQMLLARDGIPEQIRVLAEGVIAAQGPEIDQMDRMLQAWGEPTTAESGAMGHGSDGMMSEQDLGQIEDAQGTEAARLYLEQMTVHHDGAITMSQDQVENGANPEAIELAENVIAAQEAEIAEMSRMLEELPNHS